MLCSKGMKMNETRQRFYTHWQKGYGVLGGEFSRRLQRNIWSHSTASLTIRLEQVTLNSLGSAQFVVCRKDKPETRQQLVTEGAVSIRNKRKILVTNIQCRNVERITLTLRVSISKIWLFVIV